LIKGCGYFLFVVQCSQGGGIMRFNTHNATPKIENQKSVKIILAICYSLVIALFLFMAIACSLYASSIMPAVVILTPFSLLTALIVTIQKDMGRAYVEVLSNTIAVVDYYLGIKKEKIFLKDDIASVDIQIGYSLQVRGYRYTNAGMTYIVFRDNNAKYLFKIICTPETKEYFNDYLNP
jgi:hypothetical protein